MYSTAGGWVLVGAVVNVGLVRCGSAQAQGPIIEGTSSNASDQKALAAISIADEPKYIDPIELVPEALRTRVTHSFQEVPLNEVAAWIQTETGLNIVLDERALDNKGYYLANW